MVETDYVDFSRKDLDKKELLEFMLGYNERGYLEYCPNAMEVLTSTGSMWCLENSWYKNKIAFCYGNSN